MHQHALNRFEDDLKQAKNAGQAGAALHRLSAALFGARLFTIMTLEAGQTLARRAYSSDPDNYPTSGTKPVQRNSWFETVIEKQQIFVGNDIEALAAVFPDHALISALGCAACLNLPVLHQGQVVGSINILDAAGFWTEARLDLARELLPIPATATLRAMAAAKE